MIFFFLLLFKELPSTFMVTISSTQDDLVDKSKSLMIVIVSVVIAIVLGLLCGIVFIIRKKTKNGNKLLFVT